MEDSLGSDLDEGALCGGPTKKSRKAGWYQPGPSTLGEILNVNAAAATQMVQMALGSRDTHTLDRLKKFAQQPTVLTSTFTGWATYEDTFLESRQNVADALGIEVGPTVWYRAIDCNGHVQHALRHRKSSFKPLHVFDNNLDRLPEHVRRELEKYMVEQLEVLAAHKKERQLETITKAEYDQALANLNKDVLNHLRGQLKQIEFELEGDLLPGSSMLDNSDNVAPAASSAAMKAKGKEAKGNEVKGNETQGKGAKGKQAKGKEAKGSGGSSSSSSSSGEAKGNEAKGSGNDDNWGQWDGGDADATGTAKPKRIQAPRKPGEKRRGKPRPRDRTVSYGTAAASSAAWWQTGSCFNMCQVHEPSANYLAWLAFLLLFMMVLYTIYKCKFSTSAQKLKSRLVVKGDAKKSEPAVNWPEIILPEIIYVSSKLSGTSRSYHVCKTCPALGRVDQFCTAAVCKTCIKMQNKTSIKINILHTD